MSFAISRCGLRPREFWQITLPELDAMTIAFAPLHQDRAPSRNQLQELMQSHPDKESIRDDEQTRTCNQG